MGLSSKQTGDFPILPAYDTLCLDCTRAGCGSPRRRGGLFCGLVEHLQEGAVTGGLAKPLEPGRRTVERVVNRAARCLAGIARHGRRQALVSQEATQAKHPSASNMSDRPIIKSAPKTPNSIIAIGFQLG